MTDFDREQLAHWVEMLLDDSLAPEDFDQLQRVLVDQPEACELYLDLMQQNAHLQRERLHLSTTSLRTRDNAPRRSVRSRGLNPRVGWSAVAGLAASLFLIFWWNLPTANTSPTTTRIAEIADSSDAQWGDCSLPTAIGSQLGRGSLKIDRGLATIRFVSGAEVTLESPAELEIESPLSGKLIAGTAVVEVPESAHGFTLTTPTAVAIDYGTAFAVTVDTSSKTSSIEVLDGEVEVKHIASDASLRLKEKQRVVASADDLSDYSASIGEAKLFETTSSTPEQRHRYRITTADGRGADTSVSRSQNHDAKQNRHAELVLVKNPFDGYERFGRKGYFRFDLASLPRSQVASARFMLTLMPSGLGFASKVGDCEFVVYGLTEESDDDWSEENLNWNTAPANLDGSALVDRDRARELGRFTVRRGVQHGSFAIEGMELVQFLLADTNQMVTLIVVRETQESEPGGLVHGFVNRSSSVGSPPTLMISTETQ